MTLCSVTSWLELLLHCSWLTWVDWQPGPGGHLDCCREPQRHPCPRPRLWAQLGLSANPSWGKGIWRKWGGRGNSSCPLNLLLTPSLSSPEPHSSANTSSERSRVPQLPSGVREIHCIPKEAKLERRGAPTQANSSLAGPCSVAVECGVYLGPWGGEGVAVLTKCIKDKKESWRGFVGEHSVIHTVLPHSQGPVFTL